MEALSVAHPELLVGEALGDKGSTEAPFTSVQSSGGVLAWSSSGHSGGTRDAETVGLRSHSRPGSATGGIADAPPLALAARRGR